MNFKGDIGVPLENTANSYFVENKIPLHVTADEIETGAFITTIAVLLFLRYGNEPQTLTFLKEVNMFLGLPASEIPINKAYEIHKNFNYIFENNSNSK